MSTHVIADPTATHTPPSAASGPGWWSLSAALTDEAPIIAERDDLVVTIAPGAGHGSPACFLPPHAAIEINGDHLHPVDPATAQPADPTDRAAYATVWGLFTHECAHARHSHWDPPTGTPAGIAEAAMLLEESRIEAAHLARRPDDRHWLRASTRNLILDDMPTTTTGMDTGSAARAAGLLLARRDAGVLDHNETTALTSMIHSILDKSTLDTLQQVWREAHTVADDDAETMLELGRRWCAAIGTDPDTASASSTGSDGDATGDGQVDPSPLATVVHATANLIASNVADEPAPDEGTGPAAAKAAQQAADHTAQQQAHTTAQQVFGPAPGGTPAGSTGAAGTRPPTTGERRAARTLARALSTAGVTERHTTRTTAATPPGRLRMRGALAADAQRAAGQLPTAEPFTRTHRRTAPAPPLTVGIACDVSASMQPYTDPVASAAWILANATRHTTTPAESATVLFGYDVRPLTHPGAAPRTVTTFDSRDLDHDIPRAIRALDGSLALSRPGAARLLIIISDGVFEPGDYHAGQQLLDRLHTAGCGLLWLATSPDSRPMRGATVHQLTDPATTATVIGRAATAALRATARHR